MTTNNSNHMLGKLRARVALSLTLFLATFPAALSSAAQTPASASAPIPAKVSAQTPAKPTTSPASEPTGGPKEGIKVHGHWTIDVRNPDGKLVSHRDFENALTIDGATLMALILGRVNTPYQWAIILRHGPQAQGAGPCALGFQCVIVEPNDDAFAGGVFVNSAHFLNLTVNVPTGNAANANKLVLSGTATASSNPVGDDIDTVATQLALCPAGVNPCPSNFISNPTTQATLSPAVAVAANQIIQVTVVISFS